ncbi:ImmA/IrrE family metallo-endopeptidase [Candidatus Spongiisocius sp.]|uniref:ImmA/IrrE family metallo-endopeptidase n=1 Tax=Candidatus Spongiisocius sp. TaxID=3101273 RepID=UPI003B5C93DE
MNRLRSYRRIEGINQKQLGEILGISPQLVSAIESGRRSPTCDITRLGYAPTRIDVAEMTEPLHRQRASTRVTSTRRAKELLRVAGEAFLGLSHVLDPRNKNRLERLGPIQSDADIVECATEVRVGVLEKEESSPIKNLTDAAESAGICLVPIVGLEGIDGISSWVGERPGCPVIGLNVNVAGDRFRLSLAHEIGHLAMHAKRTATTENEAYRFASALLIHDDDFAASMPERPVLRDFIKLKSTWGISVAALVYKAHQLGYLDGRSYRSIQIQMSRWRKTEPGSFAIKPGRLLPKLVRMHGGVLRSARHLGLSPDHLREVITWHPLRVV